MNFYCFNAPDMHLSSRKISHVVFYVDHRIAQVGRDLKDLESPTQAIPQAISQKLVTRMS